MSPGPAAPVDLLQVHEVALVERSDCFPRRARDQHARAHRVIDTRRNRAVDAPVQRRLHQTWNRKEVEQHLGQAGKAERGALWPAIRVHQRRSDSAQAWVTAREVEQGIERARHQRRVGIEQQQVLALRFARGTIGAAGEAQVRRRPDERHRRKVLVDGIRAAIHRSVVDHDRLDVWLARGRGEGLEQHLAGVVRRDQDRRFSSRFRHAPGQRPRCGWRRSPGRGPRRRPACPAR